MKKFITSQTLFFLVSVSFVVGLGVSTIFARTTTLFVLYLTATLLSVLLVTIMNFHLWSLHKELERVKKEREEFEKEHNLTLRLMGKDWD
jgi:cell division protein FtsL